MSRIVFNSLEGDTGVHGSERRYMGNLCSSILIEALGVSSFETKDTPLMAFVPQGSYLHLASDNSGRFADSLCTYLRTNDRLSVFGLDVSIFALQLNTALVAGSDVFKLMARVHGQCEIHGYIEGDDRRCFSSVVKMGLETGILNTGVGWEDVQRMLEKSSKTPVVMSYSVCDSFPNPYILGMDGEDEEAIDEFYEKPLEETFMECFARLKEEAPYLRIQPTASCPEYWVGDGLNGFHLKQLSRMEAADGEKALESFISSKLPPRQAWASATSSQP